MRVDGSMNELRFDYNSKRRGMGKARILNRYLNEARVNREVERVICQKGVNSQGNPGRGARQVLLKGRQVKEGGKGETARLPAAVFD